MAFAEIAGNVEEHAYDLSGNSLWASFAPPLLRDALGRDILRLSLRRPSALHERGRVGEWRRRPRRRAHLRRLQQTVHYFGSNHQHRPRRDHAFNGNSIYWYSTDFRVRKIVRRYTNGGWTDYATHDFTYDGGNIVLERITFADGTIRTCEYFWGNDLSDTEQGAGGVGGLVAVSVDGLFFIPCYDHNGNIVCYVSESGTIAAQYVYDPYGNVIEAAGPNIGLFSFGFSTKYHDREVYLIGYQYRIYHPVDGRLLNRDPIEEKGGANIYVFCVNSPRFAFFSFVKDGCRFKSICDIEAGSPQRSWQGSRKGELLGEWLPIPAQRFLKALNYRRRP